MNKKSIIFLLAGVILIISSIVEFIYEGQSLGLIFLIIGISSIITSLIINIKEK